MIKSITIGTSIAGVIYLFLLTALVALLMHYDAETIDPVPMQFIFIYLMKTYPGYWIGMLGAGALIGALKHWAFSD